MSTTKKLGLVILLLLFAAAGRSYAQPAPQTVPPAALSAPADKKAADKKAANIKSGTPAAEAPSRPAIVLPPEKANPGSVPKAEKPPVIDGKLDDEIWSKAFVMKDFYQTSPGDNIEPSKKTEVLIAYDARFLYFAIHAYDEPDKVRATMAKRDDVFGEDNVRIFLDTFNDQRRAYVLGFNPLGVQQDGIYTEGAGTDFNFDIVMESKGELTSDGWIVEVAVPFKSLRYVAGKDKSWGIQVWRNIDRFNDEIDSWMPNNRDNASFLNQAGHVTGLEGILTQRQLEVIPSLTLSESGRLVPKYSLAQLAADPTLVETGRIVNEPVKFDPGVTVKLGITPTVTLDLAVNPDFAQVETDQTVVTANQRFPIFFPEKRPFFLEGIDYFQSPLNAVHTRTIIDPDLAVKLTGKLGRNTFGLLLASDNGPGDFSDEEALLPPNFRFLDKNAYIGVFRYKRNVGKESTLGFLATSYDFIDKHNDLGGFDGRIKIDAKTIFQFQVLGTTSRTFYRNPDFFKDRTENPSSARFNTYRTGKALGYYMLYDYTGRRFGYFVSGVGRTADYRADVGFTRRTNTNINEFFWRFNNEPEPKKKIIQKRIQNYNSINYDYHGHLQNFFSEVTGSLNLQRTSFLQAGVNYGYEKVLEQEFGPRRFGTFQTFSGLDNERAAFRRGVWMYGESVPAKKYYFYFFAGYVWGQLDYDFGAFPKFERVSPAALQFGQDAPLDPGPGNALDIDTGITYKPTNALNMTLGYTKSRLTRSDTGLVAYDDNIGVLRGTYQFTRFTFARIRLDYDSLASSMRGQFLVGWTPNPGTAFYIGYNDDLNYSGVNPFTGLFQQGVQRNNRTFFIKMSYLFRRSF